MSAWADQMEDAPLPDAPPQEAAAPISTGATGPPKLKLAPRGSTSGAVGLNSSVPSAAGGGSAKSNPFGAAKPREVTLQAKGVDVIAEEAKVEAKLKAARPLRFTKAQQEEVDALQSELDTAKAELEATAEGAAAKEVLAGTVAAKQQAMDDMVAKFKEMAAAAKEAAPSRTGGKGDEGGGKGGSGAPKRFERPSERRARLEAEGGGGKGGRHGGGGGYDRQDGDFSSFGSRRSGGGGSYGGGGRQHESRPGDWVCVGCQANNFASRNSCFKCNEPRADVGGGDGYGGGGYGGGRGGGGYDRQDGDFSSFSGGGRQHESRPGDWMCVGCQANNFASRNSCFKCNEPRADVGGGDGYGGGGYGGGRGGGGYDRQDGDFSSFSGGGRRNESRPGDWMCVGCQANNFASRVSCFKCNEPRT